MKTTFKASLLIMIAAAALCSCSKKNSVTLAADISRLAGTWDTNQRGGITNDILIFSIDKSAATGTLTAIRSAGLWYTSSNVVYSDIKANSDGTYSCSTSFPATRSGHLSTRNATMSLQNSNTLTVYYPALNASVPAITYVYKKSNSSVVSE